jgi:anti-anti-sigma factor
VLPTGLKAAQLLLDGKSDKSFRLTPTAQPRKIAALTPGFRTLRGRRRLMRSILRSLPKVEQRGCVKIITFTAGQKRDVENVLATELHGLTDDLGECHLLLDFTNVEFITSVELGTLIGLHKKMKATGGRLTLFNMNLLVYEVFTVTRLDNLLGICREV